MHRSPLRGTFLAAALSASVLCPAPAFAEPAVGELVSRADGVDGAPYRYADLQAASADGRFVVFRATAADGLDRAIFIRDRQAGTTTRLAVEEGGQPGDAAYWTAVDVTDDGGRVLFSFWDGTTRAHAVVTVATGQRTQLGSGTGTGALASVDFARFTNGGTGLIYSGATAAGALQTFRQVGDAAPILAASGVAVNDATRNGDVLVWSRALAPAARPNAVAGANPKLWPAERAGRAVGYTIAGQAPRVVARTEVEERTNAPAQYCVDGGVSAIVKSYALSIDDYGHRLELDSSTFDERYPNGPHYPQRVRYDLAEDGSRELWGTRSYGYPFESWGTPTGNDASPALPELKGYPDAWAYDARFYAHDTGILREELAEPRTGSDRVILAYDPISEASAPEVRTPTPLDGETADSASLTPDVKWGVCEQTGADFKLSDFATYANVTVRKPVVSSQPAGSVSIAKFTSFGDRPLSRAVLQIKTFGFVTWSRTVDWKKTGGQYETVQLPRPWFLLPQTLTVRLVSDKGFPTSTAVADSTQQSFRWTATR